MTRRISPAELTGLARKLAVTQSPAKAAQLKKRLVAGFYGKA